MNRIRSQFPSVENSETDANRPIQRQLNAWDYVLEEVKQKKHAMTEVIPLLSQVKKFEIALKAFLAKKCQRKYKKRELKKEEVVCFHRVISSHLAERVLKKFADTREKEPEKPVPPPPDTQGLERMDSLPHVTNDVFIDNEEDMVVPRNDTGTGLFDDLFQMPAVTTMAKKVEENIGGGTVEKYISRMLESDPLTEEQPHARRKELLRKIKENLKKRQKYKDRNQGNPLPKTGGAELILSNLINNEPEDEPKEPPPHLARGLSNSSINETQKKRRRKEEAFSLNWSEEEYKDVPNAKRFIEGKNTKFDNMNELLTLFVVKDPKS